MIEKFRLRHLPHWVLTDSQPAFYDLESATAIQQTEKLYGRMQELITLYNEFIDKVNKYIDEFETGIIKDFECFKKCIIKLMNDYIKSLDVKVQLQDKKIADSITAQDTKIDQAIATQNETVNNAIEFMKTNLEYTVNVLFDQAIRDGRIQATLLETYDENNETLTLSIVANEQE